MSPSTIDTPHELSQALKKEAYRLGFHLAGITTPHPPTHLAVYQRWLACGHHAGMAWMGTERARERRADPLKILPECKAILVLGLRYPSSKPPHQAQGKAQIAAYARGDDYHAFIPPRLQALVAFLQERTGNPVPNRWYTDTGPILERELAQRAGLGWIGKNTCLIHPQTGSYFLLAEIFLGIELESDSPFQADHCGRCTRCLDNCPTACIRPDRTIDANRCISYLTIEHKGLIPTELRPKLGDWAFGCDICQQVCPWNQRLAQKTEIDPPIDSTFSPRPGIPPNQLADELALTPQAFNIKFKGNPIQRSKRRGYLRNLAIVAGNRRDIQSIPALVATLKDSEPVVRGHAAWALGQIGGPQSLAALEAASKVENEPFVVEEIQAALRQLAGGHGY
jgi:epoxyqueuosine reductase